VEDSNSTMRLDRTTLSKTTAAGEENADGVLRKHATIFRRLFP
jgi:hypothetical protein